MASNDTLLPGFRVYLWLMAGEHAWQSPGASVARSKIRSPSPSEPLVPSEEPSSGCGGWTEVERSAKLLSLTN
jgi:hypothetical protein